MKIRYFTNRFLTPISVMPVPNTAGVLGLYLFGIRVAMWSVKY